MKICFVGSVQNSHCVMRAKALKQKGHDVVLISPQFALIEGLDVFAPEKRQRTGKLSAIVEELAYRYRFIKLIQQQNADVFVNVYVSGVAAWALSLVQKGPKIGVAIGSDVLHGVTNINSIEQKLTDYAQTTVDHMLVESPYLGMKVSEKGLPSEDVTMLYWGVVKENFEATKALNFELPTQRPIVFAPRGFAEVYNPELIIKSWPHVLEHSPQAVLLLLGNKESDRYVDVLKPLIQEMGLESSIQTIDYIPYKEMAPLLRYVDVVVSTSLSDGTPHSVLEAMFCETPVVALDLVHYQDVFVHDENIILSQNEPHEFAGSIVNVLENHVNTQKIVENAKEFSETTADFFHNVKVAEEAISNVLTAYKSEKRSNRKTTSQMIRYYLSVFSFLFNK